MKKYSILVLAFVFSLTACKSQQSTDNSNQSSTQTQKERPPQQSNGQQGPPSVDEVFKMDSNGDGKLSKAEVNGPLANKFDEIDTNNDGFISKTELQNAPKPERGQGRPPKN